MSAPVVFASRPPCDEDELTPGPVGSVPDLINDQIGRGQRVREFVAAPEPQRGIGSQHRTVTAEHEGHPEGDQASR